LQKAKLDKEVDPWGLAVQRAPEGTFAPSIRFARCPIQVSLGVLGKKWTLLVLRDIGFRKIDRFNRLLESVRGITPRVLSMRLRELEESGFIERVEDKPPIIVRWALTRKGRDALPILVDFVAFGARWYSAETFEDGRPRSMDELFKPEALKIFAQRT